VVVGDHGRQGGTDERVVVGHLADLQPPPPATSSNLLILTPSTTPSRRYLPNLPLPVSSLSSSIYSFHYPFLFYHVECVTSI
jgi:hypothetical protein